MDSTTLRMPDELPNGDAAAVDPPAAADLVAASVKRQVAFEIGQAMKAQGLTKSDVARLMDTSRVALDHVLDPDNTSVSLDTLARASTAVGRRLSIAIL